MYFIAKIFRKVRNTLKFARSVRCHSWQHFSHFFAISVIIFAIRKSSLLTAFSRSSQVLYPAKPRLRNSGGALATPNIFCCCRVVSPVFGFENYRVVFGGNKRMPYRTAYHHSLTFSYFEMYP